MPDGVVHLPWPTPTRALLSQRAAARAFGLSTYQLRGLIATGQVPMVTVRRRRMVVAETLAKLLGHTEPNDAASH